MSHTHYDNLRVTRNAPDSVIKSAYKALAQQYHPDRNRSPDATRVMQIVNDAYAVLSDPFRRAEYDRTLPKQRAEESYRPQGEQKTASGVTDADIARILRMAELQHSQKMDNMRVLHRRDLYEIHQKYAAEKKAMKAHVRVARIEGFVYGFLVLVPLAVTLLFTSLYVQKRNMTHQFQTQISKEASHVR